MQTFRNVLFYCSPLLGALLGGWIGLSYNAFIWVVEVLIGFGVGCLVSASMIMFSIRARFKSDVSLTRNALDKDNSKNSESGLQ